MLKLVQTDWGVFDLAVDDPAATDANAAAATVIFGVLFTDAEAPLERVDGDAFARRGWWADKAAGTGLWHVRRQPLTDGARREAEHEVRRALLARSAAFSDVTVLAVLSSSPAGNVSSVFLEIAGKHNGRNFLVKAEL